MIRLSSPATCEHWSIPVVWEDGHLLGLDKPSRLLVSPDRHDPERPNLMRLLHREIARGARWARERHLTYLANAHRLDFETSGVLLLAKTKPVLLAIANLFGSEQTRTTYAALVHGTPDADAFEVDAPLAPHPAQTGLVRVDRKHGRKAATRFEVAERFSGYTLLRCSPLTGRAHQIRVHLRHVGLPIVGDVLYGGAPLLLSRLKAGYRFKPGEPERPLLGHVALHAEQLALVHPVTGQAVTLAADWPKDLKVAVRYLKRFAVCSPPPAAAGPAIRGGGGPSAT
jgi:RluA family pseudouridine synthase